MGTCFLSADWFLHEVPSCVLFFVGFWVQPGTLRHAGPVFWLSFKTNVDKVYKGHGRGKGQSANIPGWSTGTSSPTFPFDDASLPPESKTYSPPTQITALHQWMPTINIWSFFQMSENLSLSAKASCPRKKTDPHCSAFPTGNSSPEYRCNASPSSCWGEHLTTSGPTTNKMENAGFLGTVQDNPSESPEVGMY